MSKLEVIEEKPSSSDTWLKINSALQQVLLHLWAICWCVYFGNAQYWNYLLKKGWVIFDTQVLEF